MSREPQDHTKDLEVIQQAFLLRDGRIARRSTGRFLRLPKPGERMLISTGGTGRTKVFKYHRALFALANGWLPASVDHKDRHVGHDVVDNLRSATQEQQQWNRGPFKGKASGLPKGVSQHKKRFKATANNLGVAYHLGTFDTPELASTAYQEFCKKTRGEFYADL